MSTIYIHNLNEKVLVNTLKRELEQAFQSYKVINIHMKKSFKKKGQAFISFDHENINEIIKRYNHTKLLDKPMKVEKAKLDSYELLDQSVIDSRIETKKFKVFNQPNKMLILTEFDGDKESVVEIFLAYRGFLELRVIKVKKTAFIEFENPESAAECLKDLPVDTLRGFGAKLAFAK